MGYETDGIILPFDIARALYECLMRPSKDREGHTIYAVNLNLAAELRMLLAPAAK